MLVSNFSQRLHDIMQIRNKKATDIIKESENLYKKGKINKPLTKPLISNYLKGTYEAKQDNLSTLAIILNVNEVWLMGYDVSMERENENNFRFASYNGVDIEDLTEDEIKEINNFVDYIRNKRKNGD